MFALFYVEITLPPGHLGSHECHHTLSQKEDRYYVKHTPCGATGNEGDIITKHIDVPFKAVEVGMRKLPIWVDSSSSSSYRADGSFGMLAFTRHRV